MRKFTALIIGFMVLVTAGSANAIVVDPAAAGCARAAFGTDRRQIRSQRLAALRMQARPR